MNFHVNGHIQPDSAITPETSGLAVPLAQRTFHRVFSSDVHGANPEGGIAFLSFQYWKNDVKPSSVGLNWADKGEKTRDASNDIKNRQK